MGVPKLDDAVHAVDGSVVDGSVVDNSVGDSVVDKTLGACAVDAYVIDACLDVDEHKQGGNNLVAFAADIGSYAVELVPTEAVAHMVAVH